MTESPTDITPAIRAVGWVLFLFGAALGLYRKAFPVSPMYLLSAMILVCVGMGLLTVFPYRPPKPPQSEG